VTGDQGAFHHTSIFREIRGDLVWVSPRARVDEVPYQPNAVQPIHDSPARFALTARSGPGAASRAPMLGHRPSPLARLQTIWSSPLVTGDAPERAPEPTPRLAVLLQP
jgi:hypothetical protein